MITDTDRAVLLDFKFGTGESFLLNPYTVSAERMAQPFIQGLPQADIYALAAVMYTALTGTPPPSIDEQTEPRRKTVQPLHVYRRDVPHDVSDIFQRALAFSPRSRWTSAEDMLGALRKTKWTRNGFAYAENSVLRERWGRISIEHQYFVWLSLTSREQQQLFYALSPIEREAILRSLSASEQQELLR